MLFTEVEVNTVEIKWASKWQIKYPQLSPTLRWITMVIIIAVLVYIIQDPRTHFCQMNACQMNGCKL